MTEARFTNIVLTCQRGFTLVELLITLTIAAILVSLAAPSFSAMLKNNRLSAQGNEIVLSLNYARSEAVRRGTRVSLDSDTVNWHEGWSINTQAGSTVREHAALDGSSTLVGTASNVTYRANGFLTVDDDITFTLCDDRADGPGRSIVVAPTGHISNTVIVCNPT